MKRKEVNEKIKKKKKETIREYKQRKQQNRKKKKKKGEYDFSNLCQKQKDGQS